MTNAKDLTDLLDDDFAAALEPIANTEDTHIDALRNAIESAGLGEWKKSLELLNDFLTLVAEQPESLEKYIVLSLQAIACYRDEQFDDAKKCFDDAHLLAEEINNDLLHGYSHCHYGIWFQRQGNVERAVWHFRRCIELAEPLHDIGRVRIARERLAELISENSSHHEK